MDVFVPGTLATRAHVHYAKIKEYMKGDPGKWVTDLLF